MHKKGYLGYLHSVELINSRINTQNFTQTASPQFPPPHFPPTTPGQESQGYKVTRE